MNFHLQPIKTRSHFAELILRRNLDRREIDLRPRLIQIAAPKGFERMGKIRHGCLCDVIGGVANTNCRMGNYAG